MMTAAQERAMGAEYGAQYKPDANRGYINQDEGWWGRFEWQSRGGYKLAECWQQGSNLGGGWVVARPSVVTHGPCTFEGYQYFTMEDLPMALAYGRRLAAELEDKEGVRIVHERNRIREEEKTEPTNEDRADWADVALSAYSTVTRSDRILSDLLADLRHWADRNGLDFDDEDGWALEHYEAEIREEKENAELDAKEGAE